MLYLWSILECYQYSLWRYIKLVNLNLNLGQLLVSGVGITHIKTHLAGIVTSLVQLLINLHLKDNYLVVVSWGS